MKRTEPFPPVSVEADLTLDVEGYEYRVTDSDDRLVVDAPSVGAALTLLRSLPDTGQVGSVLARTDVGVDVRVRDVVVASTGPGATGIGPTVAGSPTELRPRGIVVAAVREARARPVAALSLAALVGLLAWLLSRATRGSESTDP